jgi:branched-chain amino acid transport system substrate-binding protein
MGHSIELMNADTESKPEVARSQAERLIRDGAHVVIGAFDSGQTAAAAQACEQNGIPLVINIGADPAITEQGYKFVVRNFPTSIMLGSGSLKLINDIFHATQTAPKTAVLMIINDTFGQGMLKGLNAMLPKAGLPFEIVETISYDPQARDLSVEVAKARAAKADLHLAVTRLNDAILMIREMVKQRYEPMGVISPGAPGFYERQFIKVLGKYAEYSYSINAWMDPKQELTKVLETAFYKDFPDQSFDLNIGFCFEAALIAADAHKRAGSTKPDALMAALRTTDIAKRVMVGGPIRFNEKGQNVDTGMTALQIRDGRSALERHPPLKGGAQIPQLREQAHIDQATQIGHALCAAGARPAADDALDRRRVTEAPLSKEVLEVDKLLAKLVCIPMPARVAVDLGPGRLHGRVGPVCRAPVALKRCLVDGKAAPGEQPDRLVVDAGTVQQIVELRVDFRPMAEDLQQVALLVAEQQLDGAILVGLEP